tara:strand:+ start:45533 stop:46237 length:705 start_codon:yes stop_codon:yes gene_type:complete
LLELISNNIIWIYLVLEVLAAMTGLIFFSKYKHTVAKYFVYFLIYIVVFNVIGIYTIFVKNNGFLSFLDNTLLEKNYWWYTLCWSILSVAFYGWYYFKILENINHKKLLKFSLYIFLFYSVFVIIFNWKQFFNAGFVSIKVFGGIIILQCVFYYFLEILQSDKILTFYKSLNFYITCSILISWLVQTPLVFFEHYFGLLDMDYVNLKYFIDLIVITFMYLSFTIGIIVSNPDYD